MKSRISEVKRESDSNLISFVPIDYDMEEKLEEYKNLASAVVISGDVAQIQNDINIELGQQKEKLIDADKEATKAVIESGKALEEVKIGSRHGWSWLPWKIGAIFGLTAGVGGGVAANVPGAVIGGATGVVTGAALGSIIKKNVKKDIDKFHPEAPTMIADSPESSTMTKKPKVTKKIEKN